MTSLLKTRVNQKRPRGRMNCCRVAVNCNATLAYSLLGAVGIIS